ncbi:MAG: ATP-binding protein [Chloroflexi bacterium]|nr:ATP-binding protein [Chloroflexota bacterium]
MDGSALAIFNIRAAAREVAVMREILLQIGHQALAMARYPDHQRKEPGREDEVQWLTLVFGVMTDSLQSERERLDQQIKEIEATSTFSQSMVRQIDPEQLEQRICESLLEVSPALLATVCRVDGTFLAARAQPYVFAGATTVEVAARIAQLARRIYGGEHSAEALMQPVIAHLLAPDDLPGLARQVWMVTLSDGSRDRDGSLVILIIDPSDVVSDSSGGSWQVYETYQRVIALARERAAVTTQLRQNVEMLLRANQAKSEFLATMSHELRSPLNVIIGYSGVLLEGLDGQINPDQREDIERIARAAESLLSLISDILDFSKLNAERLELRLNLFNPREVLEQALSAVTLHAQQKGLKLRSIVDPEVTGAWGDATRIGQILLNLLTNAVKFTEQGSVTARITRIGDQVRFSIQDTGIGIPSDQLDTIFEEFHQVDGSPHRKYGGTGLGLAISQRIARLHGTRVAVSSTVNQGSTFSFTLPALAPEQRIAPGAPSLLSS